MTTFAIVTGVVGADLSTAVVLVLGFANLLADGFAMAASNHFEKLRGALAGWHSIRVNDQWRLVFRWHAGSGEASDVYLDDHGYR